MEYVLQPPTQCVIPKDDLAQLLTIQVPIGCQNAWTKGSDELRQRGLTGSDHLASNLIRVDGLYAELGKQVAHGGLASADSPGNSNDKRSVHRLITSWHGKNRRVERRKACRRLAAG